MGPWVDFIFAKVICRADAQYYTVSIGLWKMLEKEYIDSWYTCFAAGAVVVSIPIAILFLLTQKFYVDGQRISFGCVWDCCMRVKILIQQSLFM